jgi:hypothetical protein
MNAESAENAEKMPLGDLCDLGVLASDGLH